MRTTAALSCLAAVVAFTSAARGDVDGRLASALAAQRGETGPMEVLVELPPERSAVQLGLQRVAPGFAVARGTPASLLKLLNGTGARVTWAPPRHTQLDIAATWTAADAYREDSGASGAGVVVGVVDTGIDPTHDDFRTMTGATRIAWLIDFSRPAAGLHPELEEEYGCTGANECAIYSAEDLDRLLGNAVPGDEPVDRVGHGTHVASLAAGNGLANAQPRYIGVAPEASLIIARGSRGSSGSVADATILTGTRFIFERAREMSAPAVVNLSLGSDFGGHDGSSSLERGLAAFLGPDEPGRAIVVASGNSAGLYTGLAPEYPEPFGVHTEVHVPRGNDVRVPVLLPNTGGVDSQIFIYLTFASSDHVSVGLDDRKGEWLEPLAPGEGTTVSRDGGKLSATIIHGARAGSELVATGSNAAAVVLDGSWSGSEVFALRLRGHGTARAWVQSQGGAGPSAGITGALFPRASKAGTINIPASHPELIAVGASVNRTSWPARGGLVVGVTTFGSLDDPPGDTTAYFSSAGPTADGRIKPDIMAPGAFVVGAMAAGLDPDSNGGGGMFSSSALCPDDVRCLVVDDAHAVTSGTSMAAPQVAGAVALLFERDPMLTSTEVRALLQAGARQPEGIVLDQQQVGPGVLDVSRSIEAWVARDGSLNTLPSATHSWIVVADDFLRPASSWSSEVLLELRDASGAIADGFDASRLRVETERAALASPMKRLTPGLWHARISAPAGSGGEVARLRVRFDDDVLLERELNIAVDRSVSDGDIDARGGCSFVGGSSSPAFPWLLALVVLARRRRAR